MSATCRVRCEASRLYTYPDVVVACGEPRFEDEELDTLLNPTVIVEVLSPSTEGYDRGRKFELYRRLESLREYVLIAQDRVHVERYTKQGEFWVLAEEQQIDRTLRLESIGCEIPLAEVYDRVRFEDAEAAPDG